MEKVHFNDLPPDVQERIINEAVGEDYELANLYAEALRENNELLDIMPDDVDVKDTDGDGDNDLATADINNDGEPDVAAISADSKKEEKEALKTAKEELGADGDELTTTGRKNKELEDKPSEDKKHPIDCDCPECAKKKAQLSSDARQRNVLSALLDMRF